MSFVWKHPQSKYWMARFTDGHGTRRNRSTRIVARESNRKHAERIAESYEAVANRKRTARHVREVISTLHKEITGEDLPAHSFRQFADAWIERKRTEIASGTLAFYRKTISKLADFLGARAEAEISEITSDDLVAFRNASAKTLSAATVNHDLKCLRMLFRAAIREKAIADDPCEFVNMTKKSASTRRRPFTIPEIQAVVAVADEEWRSMIHFGIYTGQRLGDIASLTWQNVDLLRDEIRLVTRKTGKTMILPIAAPLRRHLEGLEASDQPDAPLHPRAFAIVSAAGRSGHLSNQFGDLLASAGLREKLSHQKKERGKGRDHRRTSTGLSFHCLRHTAVSLLKDAGIPAAAVMELIGHDSEQMSQHYTHVGQDALRKAADALPDIMEINPVKPRSK